MFSLEVLAAMNDEATRVAETQVRSPHVINTPEEVDYMPPFPFPNFGRYEPEGWTPLDIWFVDSTGHGRPGEPAHCLSSFKKILKGFISQHSDCTMGFAIVGEGQMQVHIQAFRKDD